jgi:Flp pilus assembly protein CpaB
VGAQNALRAQDPNSSLSLMRDPQAQPAARTVTLALTPDQSEKLILLENHPDCRLRLALRGANDNSQTTSGVMEFDPSDSMQAIIQP